MEQKELDYRKLNKSARAYNYEEIVDIVSSGLSDGKFSRFLEKSIIDPKNIIQHNLDLRGGRDIYFNSIKDNLRDIHLQELIKSSLDICHNAESVFDDIREQLAQLPISKKSISNQIWSCLALANEEFQFLYEKVKELREKETADGIFVISNNLMLQSDEGNSYSPDVASEKIVTFVGRTLNMLAYSNDLYIDEDLVIPVKEADSENSVEDASWLYYYATVWGDIELASQSSLLFKGKSERIDSAEFPADYKEAGIEVVYKFNCINEFLRMDAISNERLQRKITQNHFETLQEVVNDSNIVTELDDNAQIPDNKWIYHDELNSYATLMDIYCLSEQNQNKSFGGLTLKEWVRGYSFFKFLANSERSNPIYTKEELQKGLWSCGLSNEKIDLFIGYATFRKRTRDLYDSPLLKIKDGNYFFFSKTHQSSNLVNVILSTLSALDINSSGKGTGFERVIKNELDNAGLINCSFKFTEGSEQYEFDSIFLLDDKAFLLECKNTSLSSGSVVMAKRKEDFFEETENQINRLVYGLKKHPQHFKRIFGESLEKYELIPVLMNCQPFSWCGRYGDIYISDHSSFAKLLKQKELKAYLYDNSEKNREAPSVIGVKTLHTQWLGDSICAQDIINHFENPYQLDEYIDNTKVENYPLQYSPTKVFIHTRLETDHVELYKKQKEVIRLI